MATTLAVLFALIGALSMHVGLRWVTDARLAKRQRVLESAPYRPKLPFDSMHVEVGEDDLIFTHASVLEELSDSVLSGLGLVRPPTVGTHSAHWPTLLDQLESAEQRSSRELTSAKLRLAAQASADKARFERQLETRTRTQLLDSLLDAKAQASDPQLVPLVVRVPRAQVKRCDHEDRITLRTFGSPLDRELCATCYQTVHQHDVHWH